MDLRRLLLWTALGFSLGGHATAQDAASPLPAGARVRVMLADGRRIEALFARQDDRGLVLAVPGEVPFASRLELAVPSGSIRRVDVSLGKKRHALVGAAIGAVVMGLTGLSEPVDSSPSCASSSYAPCSRAEAVVVAALAGAVMGGVVGHFVQTERWAPMPLGALAPPPSAAETRAAPGGFAQPQAGALRFAVRF